MKGYGCIGKKLTHSFSKEIHAAFADYTYELCEMPCDALKDFFQKNEYFFYIFASKNHLSKNFKHKLGFFLELIKYKQNEGLKPYQKIIGQLGISIIISIV